MCLPSALEMAETRQHARGNDETREDVSGCAHAVTRRDVGVHTEDLLEILTEMRC